MKKIFAIGVCLSVFMTGLAQTTVVMGSGQTSVTGCNIVIYDNGGENGNYAANSDNTLTIHSSDPSHGAVKISVLLANFNVHSSDTLFIYDGTSTSAPLLGALNDTAVSYINTPALVYVATVSNVSGALTLRFKSDGADEGTGYMLKTSCIAPCQRVNVKIDTAHSSHIPHPELDTGGHLYYYIDLCPYDTLHLTAYGVYPDNNLSYAQSDATSTFTWDLGEDLYEGKGLSTLVHHFTPGRGYDMSVNIVDSAGCPSYIPQTFRVRTSKSPIRDVIFPNKICSGQPFEVSAGYDMVSNVQFDTVGSEQLTTLYVTDTIFLPDGEPCHDGHIVSDQSYCSYKSPVTFSAFSPTAMVTSANDVLYVRLSIEHSFVGDLWIRLTCPNGKYVSLLKKYTTGDNVGCASAIPLSEWGWQGNGISYNYFGAANDLNSSMSPCDPNVSENAMGICWNYCWSNTDDQGYVYNPGSYVYSSSNSHNGSFDSTNVAQMTNVFHPDGNFSNLIGCPLNGTWSIEVLDGWNIDNGYVCGWELALDPSLLPQNWSYDVAVDSVYILGPGSGGTYVVPDAAGDLHYDIYVIDDYGCVYDTFTTVQVIQSPEPNIGEDFFICQDEMITLSSNYDVPHTTYRWNNGDETDSTLVLSAGVYSVMVATSDEEGMLTCYGSDTINIGVYPSPDVRFDAPNTTGCAPLTIRFSNRNSLENTTYQWTILRADGSVAMSSNLQNPVFKIDEPGVYDVFLRCTTPDGCVDSLLKKAFISVKPQPIAEFLAEPEISLMSENDGQVKFTNYMDTTVMDDTGYFYWDFDDGETDSSTVSPVHTFAKWGDYNVALHVQTGEGCYSEIVHTVVIEQDLKFPNVITPNGDGKNDVFAIENLNTGINEEDPDEYRTNDLYIYDRWGSRVYRAHNYDTFSRDGEIFKGKQIFDGKGLADGVYYFSFHYKGKAKTVNYNGSLTIIR